MFQLILLATVIYILYKWLRHSAPQSRPPRTVDPPPQTAGQVEEMLQDPVCGTWVPVSQALSMQHGKETIHFCSAECRDKFLKVQAERKR